MNIIKKLFIYALALNVLFANEAEEVLFKALNRFNGIDRYCFIEIAEQKKNQNKKYKKFHSWTYWDENNIKKERVLMVEPDRLKNVNFWSHTDGNNVEKWMTMPKIGKLKKVKGRFSKKDEFDFSELELKKENIVGHVNSIIGVDKINDREVYIIENIKQNKKGEVKLKKHIWIDKKDFFIHKAIYINRKDKLIKEINLSDLLFINGKPILSKINVQDFKKNKNISIVFKDISFNKITDFDMFVPKSIK